MPVSSSSFERSERAPSVLLVDFLSTNYRDAFSLDELVKAMASLGRKMSREDLEILLTSLEYGGKVQSKVIDAETYYRYSKPFGFKLI